MMRGACLVFLIFVSFVGSVPFQEQRSTPLFRSAKDFKLQSILDKLPEPIEDHKVIGKFDQEEVMSHRLPNDSIPLRYDIQLKTDIDKGLFEYSGTVKIHIKKVLPTNTITLHYRQIKIESVSYLTVDGSYTQPNLDFKYVETFEFLQIFLPSIADDEFVLEIKYNGTLREDRLGFYRSSYKRQDTNETVWLATTQFSMTEARHAVPSYDEPGIRAVMSMEIQHDKSYFALSNTPVAARDPVVGTDYVKTKFRDTPKMQTYILGFIICDYDFITNNDVNMEHRVYARKDAVDEGKVNLVLEVAEPILKKLEEYFDMPYPLPKMDHVAIPDFAFSAMENNGLITYREQVMFYDPETSSDDFKKTLIELIAHETTHMWFGNIVSPKWWSYTWLKEGFASLFQFYIPHMLWPDEDHLERFRTKTMQSAFNVDVEDFDPKPLNFYVETPQNIRNKFDTISYRKGASFLRMIQEAVGEMTFIKGLKYFLVKMEDNAAVPDDVHESLQKAYDEDFPETPLDLTEIMNSWEEQPGYPTVSVQWDGDKIKLSQKRTGGGDEIYQIPITFATKLSPDFGKTTPALWMTTETTEISGISKDDWVIFNNQQSGYWQLSYSPKFWDKIIDQLQENPKIVNKFNRAELFTIMQQDISNGTLAEKAFYGLEMLSYLVDEKNNFVWQRVLELDLIFATFLSGSSVYSKYQELVGEITKPHLETLGMENVAGESLKNADMRKSVKEVMCRNFLPECLHHELEKLKKFTETGQGSYNLCEGVRLADKDLHKHYVDVALTAEPEKRQAMLVDLVCSLDKEILVEYFETILESFVELDLYEVFFILSEAMTSSVTSLDVAFDFILENFDAIDEKIPYLIPILLYYGAGNSNNVQLVTKLMQITEIAKNKEVLTDEGEIDIGTTAAFNLIWLQTNMENIRKWFGEENGTTTVGSTTLGAAQMVASLTAIVFAFAVKFLM